MEDTFAINDLGFEDHNRKIEREKALEKIEEIRQYKAYTGFFRDSESPAVRLKKRNNTSMSTIVGVKKYYDNVLRGISKMHMLSDNYYAFVNDRLLTYTLCAIYPYGRHPEHPKTRTLKKLAKKLEDYKLVSKADIQYTGKIFTPEKCYIYGYEADITHIRRLLTADV